MGSSHHRCWRSAWRPCRCLPAQTIDRSSDALPEAAADPPEQTSEALPPTGGHRELFGVVRQPVAGQVNVGLPWLGEDPLIEGEQFSAGVPLPVGGQLLLPQVQIAPTRLRVVEQCCERRAGGVTEVGRNGDVVGEAGVHRRVGHQGGAAAMGRFVGNVTEAFLQAEIQHKFRTAIQPVEAAVADGAFPVDRSSQGRIAGEEMLQLRAGAAMVHAGPHDAQLHLRSQGQHAIAEEAHGLDQVLVAEIGSHHQTEGGLLAAAIPWPRAVVRRVGSVLQVVERIGEHAAARQRQSELLTGVVQGAL